MSHSSGRQLGAQFTDGLTGRSTRTRSGIAPQTVQVSVRLAAQFRSVPVNSDVRPQVPYASKIILHCPRGYTAAVDVLVEDFIREGVKFVGVVGVDCARIEDIVDELVVGGRQ